MKSKNIQQAMICKIAIISENQVSSFLKVYNTQYKETQDKSNIQIILYMKDD
ncbi:unnamed protein product [Paramecium octaurelia]|uniref:Uncharacterized protein n=1 Tax=Paramecium octaurelia TaxID=43137 RepID=A0A8S1VT74_PAROT|nr:unnamed protein product [Paramecium octaurelia]